MKNKIFIALSTIGVMLITIIISFLIGNGTISFNTNSNNQEFVKNGYKFKKAEIPSGYLPSTSGLQCFSPWSDVGEDKIMQWIYMPKNDRAYKIAEAYTNNSYTLKYDLALLFIIQNLPIDEKINKLKSLSTDDFKRLINLIDTAKQYKISKEYCIVFNTKTKYIGNNQFKIDGDYVYKVQCSPKAVSLNTQPTEFAFMGSDENGIYFKYYDYKKLWKEFKHLGIDGVKDKIEEEKSQFIKYLYTNCSRSLGL
ncbi:hypothetical protein J6G99_08495 [bacterium]|nr:hypothetical protein [bacterium]